MWGERIGSVIAAQHGVISIVLPGVAVGEGVFVEVCGRRIRGIVRGVTRRQAVVLPWGALDGVVPGAPVQSSSLEGPVGMQLLGHAFDGFGVPLDGRVPGMDEYRASMRVRPPAVGERAALDEPLWTGVRSIDALLTLARGARIGIFGSPGSGKSALLQQLAGGMSADAVVVALIGERGREARAWIDTRMPHATIIAATSDRAAAERAAAAQFAFAQAHNLRARGLHVLLVLDSLARYASAQREIGLACGEPCGRGGFPAGVFGAMAELVEIAGATRAGSITLVASVLTDGDDVSDPVSEAARSLLDGHIVLSNVLARKHHYPAIDILASTSRTMSSCVPAEHLRDAAVVRRALSALTETEDARAIGLPVHGVMANRAVALGEQLTEFLTQEGVSIDAAASRCRLAELAALLEST